MTEWQQRRVRFKLVLMVKRIASFNYVDITRDDGLSVLRGPGNHPVYHLSELYKEFDAVVTKEMSDTLSAVKIGAPREAVIHCLPYVEALEALLRKYYVK